MTPTTAYRNPNVLRWLAAYTASVAGDVVYFLALAWSAAEIGGPSAAGVAAAVGALPRAVLMLAGGVVADRFGPRRAVIGSDAVRCVLILGAAGWLWLATPGMWLLLSLAAVFGVVDALFMPAVGALPPRIAPVDQLGRIQAMRSLSIRASNLAGPAIAGVAMGFGGIPVAFAVAGGMFLVSLVLLLAVRVTPLPRAEVEERSAWLDLRDGLGYIRRHRVLGPLLVAIALSEMCFSGPVALVMILLADERGWGASAVGWLLGAFSVGAAVSGIVLTVRARVANAGYVCAGFFTVTAATAAALPFASMLPVATGLAVLMGAASGVAGIVAHALVQTHSAPEYLGRVTAALTLGTLGLAPILFPLAGFAAAAWGTGPVLGACAVITFGAAVTMTSTKTLRRSSTAPS